MPRRPRQNHTPAFKAKVALAALKGERTLAALAQQFDGHPNPIKVWKAQLLEGAAGVFAVDGNIDPATPAVYVKAPTLEHFPHKWDPVVRKKTRHNKDLERPT